MTETSMAFRSAVEIADEVRRGSLKAETVIGDAFSRIAAHNPQLNAFVLLDEEGAMRSARAVDRLVGEGGDPGPLAGVPFGVKDLEDMIGLPTTQGSYFRKGGPPKTADAPHVARLRRAGGIPLGKTATAEFGLDSATNTTAWGVTRNPWNLDMTPGGSSGGSAAAVAAGLVPMATGSDSGGSIREPAAFTGLVGLKPSHGRIAKAGGFSNFAVDGILTRTVADTARYLDVAAGPDDRDRQSLPAVCQSYEAIIETLPVAGLRAVWSEDYGYAVVEPEVARIARRAAEQLIAAAGLDERDRAFCPTNIKPHWSAVMLSSLEADLAKQGIMPDDYPMLAPQTRLLIDRIRTRPIPDLDASWAEIRKLTREVAALFEDADLLMSPATACAPYAADSTIPDRIDGRDASQSNVEPFGMLANICWNPSISIPAGITAAGLPVGLQITARRHRDDILLRLARIHETVSPWSFPELENPPA